MSKHRLDYVLLVDEATVGGTEGIHRVLYELAAEVERTNAHDDMSHRILSASVRRGGRAAGVE